MFFLKILNQDSKMRITLKIYEMNKVLPRFFQNLNQNNTKNLSFCLNKVVSNVSNDIFET